MKSVRKKLKNLSQPINSRSKLFTEAERRHIQAHLALTELRLRLSRSSKAIYLKRKLVLEELHNYWVKGDFPHNTYKVDKRTPVFIDQNGVHCAVGHLMAQTGYENLANTINKNNKFSTIENIESPEVELWLKEYGLSLKEAALVQPGYGFAIERASNSIQDRLLAVTSIIACLVLLGVVYIALFALKDSTVLEPNRRTNYVKLAVAAVLIIPAFIFYLPNPIRAARSLVTGEYSRETVYCAASWSQQERTYPEICNEFVKNNGVPGWQSVESDEPY